MLIPAGGSLPAEDSLLAEGSLLAGGTHCLAEGILQQYGFKFLTKTND